MRTILIFDSSAVTCHTVSKQLRAYGFDTVQARSLGDARVALASKPIDLIFLDLAAPDAGGMTLLRELRQACAAGPCAYQKVPIITLTSSARDSDRIDARVAGAAAFLTKPVSTRELLLTVNSALALAGAVRQVDRDAAGPGGSSPAARFPQRRELRPDWAAPPS
jgi:DNA-binding response OmpR family regulator